MWGETILFYRWIIINKCRRKKWNKKSLLEFQSNNCYMQNPQVNAKISGQNFKEKQYYLCNLKISPPPYLLKLRENSNFTVEKSGRHHQNQVIKVNNIISNESYWHHVTPDIMHWGHINPLAFFQKICKFNLTMRKHQRKPNWMIFYKIPDQQSLKMWR